MKVDIGVGSTVGVFVGAAPKVMVYVPRLAQFVFWATTTPVSSTAPDAPLAMVKSNDSELLDSLYA
jgi:hypothetical protein